MTDETPKGEESLPAEENVAQDEAAEATKDTENDEVPEFAAGDIVELHSLSVESLNGVIGRLYSQKGERFVVVLPPPEKDGDKINLDPWQYKSIKPKNLRKLDDQENEKKLFQDKPRPMAV